MQAESVRLAMPTSIDENGRESASIGKHRTAIDTDGCRRLSALKDRSFRLQGRSSRYKTIFPFLQDAVYKAVYKAHALFSPT